MDAFVHAAVRHGGALAAAMGGVDALAFTGGIGEHADAGARAHRGGPRLPRARAAVHVVAAREERRIARDALALMARP